AVDTRNDQPGPRDDIDETAKRRLDGLEIGVYIRMVKLDIFQKNDPRQVMQKLGSLIEEGGVVFVSFNDEIRPVGHLKATTEVLCDAADKKRRFSARHVQYPGQH